MPIVGFIILYDRIISLNDIICFSFCFAVSTILLKFGMDISYKESSYYVC